LDFEGTLLRHSQFDTAVRVEWGLTDRWELDLVFAGAGERREAGSTLLGSNFAARDAVFGARYRFLQESSAPFTLTMGPQLILPTGDPPFGRGSNRLGLAWDVAAAKDWGGPVFLFASANYGLIPSVRDAAVLDSRSLNLHNLFGAFAVGLRPLEKRHGSSRHDVHAFLEFGVGREESLERAKARALKAREVTALFAPGIRYGLLTRKGKLFEIGVALPLGLNDATPRRGILFQVQFEQTLLGRGE
jgi:hypothetical protein